MNQLPSSDTVAVIALRARGFAQAVARQFLRLCPGLVFGAGAVLGMAADQPALDARAVVRMILEASPTLAVAEREAQIARGSYRDTLLAARPAVTAELTPYAYRPAPIGSETVRTHSFGAAVGVRQLLPTSGTLTAALGHTITITGEQGDPLQLPSVQAQLRQPIPADGNVFGTTVFEATRRLAAIGYETALLSAEMSRAQVVRAALGLFVQVASLERNKVVLERTIEVLQRQLELARINREQGLISETTLLALQLPLNARREALFEVELALLQARRALARALGADALPNAIDDDLRRAVPDAWVTALSEATPSNAAAPAWQADLSVRFGELAVERARASAVSRGTVDRPSVTLSAAAVPNARFATFDTMFGSGVRWDSSFSVGVSVPLSNREQRTLRAQSDRLSEEIALLQLDDARAEAADRLDTLRASRGFLEQRRVLIEADVAFERRRTATERSLLDVGATTALAVDEVALDLLARETELWQIDAQLFLNALEVALLTGFDAVAYAAP